MLVFLNPILLLAGLVVIFRFIHNGRKTLSRFSHLPWIGLEDSSVIGLLKCRFRNATDFSGAVKEAFDKYSSKGETCVIPILTAEFVALPPSELEWIVGQPDNILNAKQIQEEALQSKWTTVDPFIMENSLHRDLIKRDLTRRLGDLTSDIIDELASSIDEEWGTDTENWKEVVPFETLMRVIARTSNRVFIGLPLCRDPVLLENGKGFATQLPLSALILGQIPNWIRPALAKTITYKGKRHASKFIDCIRPTILARQAVLNSRDSEKAHQPNDFLQWLVIAASRSDIPRQNDPFIIGGRLLNVNFAAIHTSTFSITNAIFDLASPPSSQQVISELRHEATSVLAANNDVWTKQGLTQLVKTDSALRESSRLGSFVSVGLIRKVLVPEGITSPISKTFLPQGSRVCVLTTGIHTSESNYADAMTYKPFRFSNIRSAPNATLSEVTDTKDEALSSDGKSSTSQEPLGAPPPYTELPNTHLPPASDDVDSAPLDSYLSRASLSFVTTSPTYHPFGHGRHACPGRFFAANELKLLLAYLVLNYDFEMLDARPANKWLSTTVLPPMKEKIRVRRRRG